MKKKLFIAISDEKIWLRKFLWAMNQFAFIMLFGALSLSAKVYSQEDMISMQMKQVSLVEVFNEVTRMTGYDFLYNYDVIQGKGKVNVDVAGSKLDDFLHKLLSGKGLDFEFRDGVIVVRTAEPEYLRQQQKKEVILKGKVTDYTGHPMPGVSVYIENNTIGVATDINGQYSLPFPEGERKNIVYSFIGMKKVVFRFEGRNTTHNVVLEEDKKVLEDVVVIGYGSKQKRDLTSAVSSVKADELVKSAGAGANTFDNMLGGAVKGVMVTQNSGELGASASVNIRGITSPLTTKSSANEPLYVIDGVPFNNDKGSINPLSTIASDDIESIDVLKDAAATSIYGSRGANGVIIVKTKSGHRNQKMTITAGYTLSVGNAANEYKPLNTTEFKELQTEIAQNLIRGGEYGGYNFFNVTQKVAGGDIVTVFDGLREDKFGTANTNWVNETKNRNALSHQYNFAVRGGSELTNYSFSFNGTNQEGLFVKDKLERYGARLSLDTDISRRFKAGASLSYTFSKHKDGETNGQLREWVARPDVGPYTDGQLTRIDGKYVGTDGVLLPSPLATRLLVQNEAEAYQFMGNSYLEYEVVKNLKLHGDINLSVFQDKYNGFSPKAAHNDWTQVIGGSGGENLSSLNVVDSRVAMSSINLRVDYSWTKNLHTLNVMAGYGWDRTFATSSSAGYEDFPDDEVLTDIKNAKSQTTKDSDREDDGLNSVYGRLGYIYNDKYLAEVNFRSDASSKFGPGNKRGYFPSLSLGWRMNKENFMAGAGWVDNLKLRFSTGRTGSNNVSTFSYMQFFQHSDKNIWGGDLTVGLTSRMPNRDIRWEMTTEFNGGLDFGFWQNRLFGSVDVYYRYTDGALAPAPASLESGFGNYTANLIDMSNKGMEVEVGGDIIRTGDWRWTSSVNVAFNRNKIESLNGATLDETQIDYYVEGHPAGILKGYLVEKIFQSQEEIDRANAAARAAGHSDGYYPAGQQAPGDYKFRDVNGDGQVTRDDRVIIASPEPKFFGGFFNSVSWKGLNLSFMFQFSQGASAFLGTLWGEQGATPMQSVTREMFRNSWTPERTGARYARLMPSDPGVNASTESDPYVFKTSYLRLKNVALSYDLPAEWLRTANIEAVQVFAGISNLWTLTKWPGIDPEMVAGGSPSSGMGGNMWSNDPYPLSRTFSVGLKIQF